MSEGAVTNRRVVDEIEIIRIVDEVDNTVDEKDWTACRGYFLDDIRADFTSLTGGSPGTMKADDLVGGLGELCSYFTAHGRGLEDFGDEPLCQIRQGQREGPRFRTAERFIGGIW